MRCIRLIAAASLTASNVVAFLFKALLTLTNCPALRAQRLSDLQTPASVPDNSTVVLGFLGGFEKWNDVHRSVRKVALQIRSLDMPGVFVDTLENRRQPLALKLLARAGVKKDSNIRVILYGQSWGGSAVVDTARALHQQGVPVLLTVQVDSVGLHDFIVPSNVRVAANIYQRDGLGIQGRAEIVAEDPESTRILENTRRSYLFKPYGPQAQTDASWARRAFGGSHAKMELDSAVWEHVEALILGSLKGNL